MQRWLKLVPLVLPLLDGLGLSRRGGGRGDKILAMAGKLLT